MSSTEEEPMEISEEDEHFSPLLLSVCCKWLFVDKLQILI